MANPIVLAFSGGLDTSFCIPWLAEKHGRPGKHGRSTRPALRLRPRR